MYLRHILPIMWHNDCNVLILYFSDNQNMRLPVWALPWGPRPQDSRLFWDSNSSGPEMQRILLVNYCRTSGMIIILHISLVLGEYSRYLAWEFELYVESEDTHQGKQMVTTKSQDHITSPALWVSYIANLYWWIKLAIKAFSDKIGA